ncbi:MAG: (d)CMP kinase [Lentisphaeria bacterium]|nr:(d)CMP kinase [Lentisphaeria bacterium]
MSTVVAIDGPAGAGKSTVARRLAERLGYAYINTGSLYRALAFAAKSSGIAFSEIDAGFLNRCELEFRGADLYLNGCKLGDELRAPECAQGASVISGNPLVRDYLMPVQRNSANGQWIVMEGRDIGTVVFPDAEKKFFVTASPEERARRRMAQSSEVAADATFESILADIIARDERDSKRAIAPLKQAADAVLVDTTGMSIDEVVEYIAEMCR